MKHRIDPKIDCVFKALLGSVENRNLLIHFLNAILTSDLTAPITEAEILNPYNDKEFLDDKLSVVDVKAKDSEGRLYQIEIQLLTYRHLPERMVYTWCDIISQHTKRQRLLHLMPVYSGGCWRKTCCPAKPTMPMSINCKTAKAAAWRIWVASICCKLLCNVKNLR